MTRPLPVQALVLGVTTREAQLPQKFALAPTVAPQFAQVRIFSILKVTLWTCESVLLWTNVMMCKMSPFAVNCYRHAVTAGWVLAPSAHADGARVLESIV